MSKHNDPRLSTDRTRSDDDLIAENASAPIPPGLRAKASFDKLTTRNAFEDARRLNAIGEHKTHKRGHRVYANVPEGQVEILGKQSEGFVLAGAEREDGVVVIYVLHESAILKRVPGGPDPRK
jgi:hypothetical protein